MKTPCFFSENCIFACPVVSYHVAIYSKTKEAYGACGQISAGQGWALWYLRPKVHMFEHVLPRDCN